MNSINSSIQSSLAQTQQYTGIYGWFQNLIGRAIQVVDPKKGHTLYFNKASLLNQLCQHATAGSLKQGSLELSDLMLQVLNPVKGLPITINKVKLLFRHMGKAMEGQKPTEEELSQKLTLMKNRHLSVMTYTPDKLAQVLKPGDIFFKKNPENSHNVVVRAQRVFRNLTQAKLTDRESYKYSHVAIYVGEGQVAEAVTAQDGGVQIRLVKLDDPRFALDKEHGYEYVITRGEDQALAFKAASLAKSIAKPALPLDDKQENKHAHKYAFINAARSLYHSSSFGLFAKQRYFKQYIDERQHKLPLSFMSAKDFFCSNFVSFCYQTAESQTVIPEKLGVKSEPIKGLTSFGTALFRGIWARYNRWKYIYDLDKHVKMKFDAKWLNPQDFRNFVVGNPTIFKDKMLLQFG